MSADNWAVCPRCKANRQRAADYARGIAQNAYGRVEIAKFDKLRAEADRLASLVANDADEYKTFREDYEIYGAEDGEVVIRYSGGCTKCALSLSVEHEHPLPVDGTK